MRRTFAFVVLALLAVLGISAAGRVQNPGPSAAIPNPDDVRMVGNRFAPLAYQVVSMLLNTDRYPLPAGVEPELKPLP